MESCKNFAKKYPLVLVVLTPILLWALLKGIRTIPTWQFSLGVNEVIAAVVVFIFTFLFMGKEKVKFQLDGFRYGFRMFRGYFIFMLVFGGLVAIGSVVTSGVSSQTLINLVNVLLVGLTVGIVEEFTYRGLVFGGILQKIGRSKKNIIIAAVVSSLIFGVMHVADGAIVGEISNSTALINSVLKTVQSGVFGVAIAFVYIKTRNIHVVCALHGVDDFILYLMQAFSASEGVEHADYVSGGLGTSLFGYTLFTIIVIPMVIKSMNDLEEDEPCPYDDDFKPRAVKYEKRRKKEKS